MLARQRAGACANGRARYSSREMPSFFIFQYSIERFIQFGHSRIQNSRHGCMFTWV